MKPLTDVNEWPKIAVYDIEATEWVNFTLVCHVDEYGERKAFRSMREYLNWLFEVSDCDHVWAHWGGRYDARFVLGECYRAGWHWEVAESGGLLVIATVHHPNGRTIRFCDSARLMPDSVAKIGKTVGLPKLDVDRSHIEKLTIEEAIAYCFRDCDIVLLGLQYLRDTLLSVGADFSYTLASIAARWVRRSDVLKWDQFVLYRKKRQIMSPMQTAADAFCAPAYAGGRVEAFKVGTFTGPLYYYDVRSSYPYSMTKPLPAYPRGLRKARPSDHVKDFGVSDATVHVPDDCHIPLLGLKSEGKLLFPTGTIRGRWTNVELQEAVAQGWKVDLHSVCHYEQESFLAPFVATFYALRKAAITEGDSMKSYIFKILLNSLYGKLIEQMERKQTVFGTAKVDALLKKSVAKVKPTNVPGVFTAETIEEGPFRHVAAGAYVTAYSRLLLWQKMQDCLRLGGQVFYCDTDSIVTDVCLKPEIDELGTLKLETVFVELEIVCPKVYRGVNVDGEEVYKVKGTPVASRDGKKLGSLESMSRWRSYLSGEGVSKEGVSGFASDLRIGSIDPRAVVLKRGMRKQDSKRTHLAGNSVPLRFR